MKIYKKFLTTLVIFLICSGISYAGDVKIGVSLETFNIDFVVRYKDAMTREAARLGAKFVVTDAENSQRKEKGRVDELISSNVDVLLVSPSDRFKVDDLIKKAKSANIPIVFIIRQPLPEAIAKYDKAWYIGTNSSESGRMQGEIMADYLKAHPEADKNHDGKIQYVIIQGQEVHQDTKPRAEFAVKALKDAGFELDELAHDVYTNWQRDNVIQVTNELLKNIDVEKIEAVFAHSEEIGLGVIHVLKSKGYNTGDKNKFIPIVCVDGSKEGLQAMANNEIIGTVLHDAETLGSTAVKFAVAVSEKKQLKYFNIDNRKFITVPYKKITPEHYQEYVK